MIGQAFKPDEWIANDEVAEFETGNIIFRIAQNMIINNIYTIKVYPLHDHTCYALELGALVNVPEWSQEVTIALEETVVFSGGRLCFLGGRQTKLHLV